MTRPQTPRVASFLRGLFVPGLQEEFVRGDLEETFAADCLALGARRARRRYWKQVLTLGLFRLRAGRGAQQDKESRMSRLSQDLKYGWRTAEPEPPIHDYRDRDTGARYRAEYGDLHRLRHVLRQRAARRALPRDGPDFRQGHRNGPVLRLVLVCGATGSAAAERIARRGRCQGHSPSFSQLCWGQPTCFSVESRQLLSISKRWGSIRCSDAGFANRTTKSDPKTPW